MYISERKKKILAAVVHEYIETAEPVGSKTIASKAQLGCSSATIRNELAELTSMGLLEQPHTSAGRVPTPQGYRLYVNELMHHQRLSLEETEEINRQLNDRVGQLNRLISDVSAMASRLTAYPALATTAHSTCTILRFDLIYVDANTFIIVAMLSNNTAKSKLVHLPVSVEQQLIVRLSTLANANFTGIPEEKITSSLIAATERAAGDNLGLSSVIASFALELLTEARSSETFLSGESLLLQQPEFQDPVKAHRLMNYLSDGEHLSNLPVPNSSSHVSVLIGPENVAEELRDSSVVVATYDAGDNAKGIIGIVGPTRMDYSTVAAKLACLADALSRRLASGDAPPTGMHNKLIVKGDHEP